MDHLEKSGWPGQFHALLSSFFATARMRKKLNEKWMVRKSVVAEFVWLSLDLVPEVGVVVDSILECDVISVESAATFLETVRIPSGVIDVHQVQDEDQEMIDEMIDAMIDVQDTKKSKFSSFFLCVFFFNCYKFRPFCCKRNFQKNSGKWNELRLITTFDEFFDDFSALVWRNSNL